VARYLTVDLPEVFAIEVPSRNTESGWIPYWQYLRREWLQQQPDGSYVSGSIGGGSPVYLRVRRVLPGGVVEHVDGQGEVFRYRIKPLTDAEIQGSEVDLGPGF